MAETTQPAASKEPQAKNDQQLGYKPKNEHKIEPPQVQSGAMSKTDINKLATRVRTESTAAMNPVEYEQRKMMARDFIKSGSIPSSFANEYQVLMALNAGHEMGLKPTEALQSLYIVNGTLKAYGRAVPRQLRRHGYRFGFVDGDDQCTIRLERGEEGNPDYELYEETVTFEEAEQSGYTKDRSGNLKVGWKKGMNRRRKLRFACLSLIVDTYVPEVLSQVDGIGEMAQEYGAAETNADPHQRAQKALEAHRKPVVDTTAKVVGTEQ